MIDNRKLKVYLDTSVISYLKHIEIINPLTLLEMEV